MPRFAAAALAISAAAASATVYAATPDGGTISPSQKKVDWTGQLFNSGPIWDAWHADPSIPCPSDLQCDAFNLKVAGAGDVAISVGIDANPANGAPDAGIRITKPDESYVYASGESTAATPFTFVLEGAEAGDYVVHATDSLYGSPHDYAASAVLDTGAPAGGGGGTTNAGGGNTGGGGGNTGGGSTPPPSNNQQQPAPQQQQQPSTAPRDFTLTAKAPKVSARKAKKSFRVAVTTSRPIEKVTVFLKKGKKTVGGGTVKPFAGKGAVKVSSKGRLKKGSYDLVVLGQDGTVRVGRTIKLKIAR